jgi:hypothetical protein
LTDDIQVYRHVLKKDRKGCLAEAQISQNCTIVPGLLLVVVGNIAKVIYVARN